MKNKMKNILLYIGKLIFYAETYLLSALILWVRFFIGYIFFRAGMLSIKDWQTALYLYQYEHPVPFLSTQVAAVLGTFGELTLPLMLFAGLGTRIGAIGLCLMSLLIEITYMSNKDHYFWMVSLCFVALCGGGLFSCDYLVKQKYGHLLTGITSSKTKKKQKSS